MSDPVGFGVIGANSFVANAAVLPAIAAAPNAQLVATASRSGAVPARWADTDVGSYEAVVAHPDVDAVYIPLPNGMHHEWTQRCADAGKHVLCEKPLASDVATARDMASACADAGVLLAEAWMTPFHQRYAEVVSRARAGDLGDLASIKGSFRFTIGPEASDNYRWDPVQGGGALLDVGIYCLGAIVDLFGARPDTIVASRVERSGVDASTDAVLMWPGRHVASIHCSFVDHETQLLEIHGADGSFAITSEAFTGGPHDSAYEHTPQPFLPEDTPPDAPPAATRTIHVETTDSYQAMVEAFGQAIRGATEWPRPIERSIEMLELIERIKDAARD